MKISRIECENFRNFRDPLEITFPTDGSVTIIYGPNGVGKTTLHQLFQWIIYGVVHFNKTATNQMYNLDYEHNLPVGKHFSVVGSIDFEHPNKSGKIEYYSMRRVWTYSKEKNESKLIGQQFKVMKRIGDNWSIISTDPSYIVEQVLPSGLSQYFFFDGESMIADLSQTGKASAKQLRKALYSIFDLDIYEKAQIHIGAQTSKSTVLGKLYDKKSEGSSDSKVLIAKGEYNQAQKQLADWREEAATCDRNIKELREKIRDLSEKIGGNTSKKALEAQRKTAKDAIKDVEKLIDKELKEFGSDAMRIYPYLFISRIVEQAQMRIGLKVEEEKLLPGLTKELILSLVKESRCLCGNCIGDAERLAIAEYEKKFPPLSYKYIYDQFKVSATRWSANYDDTALIKHISAVQDYRARIERILTQIHDIDVELKSGENVDQWIAERASAEESLRFWEKKQKTAEQTLGVRETVMKQKKRKLDEVTSSAAANKVIDAKIEVMEAVYHHFEKKLLLSTNEYSKKLNKAIQDLVDRMLVSKRTVKLTPKFELSVMDTHSNESKSEGQFAVVSFAYIGGIFKLLSEVDSLKGKEYPLVLDGPFSKLDARHRQNVIDTIPSYAPQVILFSKDDINSCFHGEAPANVWTIYSNDERNVSYVEKGYNAEVFNTDGIYE